MIERSSGKTQKGFTLIELLGVAMIFTVLAFISLYLFNSVKARNQHAETQDRLNLITAKIKQYYETHERLPAAAGATRNEVPVQPGGLDMEQKYRLDAWGRYLVYYAGNPDNPDELQDIQKEELDLRGTAASLLSGGPDQNPATEADNARVLVDVTAEAKRITQDKLKLLQEKVAAYDAMFAGIDNDGDGTVDDTGDAGGPAQLRGVIPALDTACPPASSFANDPSQGLSTLDAIEDGSGQLSYNCSPPLINHIVTFYGLPDNYRTDPWRDDIAQVHWPFSWGYEGRLRDDGQPIGISDPRYHRFFSSGPDHTRIEDDIIASAE